MNKKKYFIPFIIFLCVIFNLTNVYSQYDHEKAFAFLQQLYNQHDKKLSDYLITEMEHYLKTFPESGHSPEILLLLGKVNEKKGGKSSALALYLKILFLYPENEKASEAIENIRQLIGNERKFAKQRTLILKIAEAEITSDSTADRYFQYLENIVKIDESNFNKITLKALRKFIHLFPADSRSDQVQIWLGDFYAKNNDNREADLSYAKFIQLFPESPLMPQLMYRRGILQYQKLKQHDQAIETFIKIKEEFPESNYAADALMVSGEIKEKKKKDYQAAISDYRMVVDDYPHSPEMIEALWNIAKINKDKLKEYPTAILAFNKIIEIDTTNQKSLQALEEIAEIYKKKLKDFEQAAATYLAIAETYPDYSKAPDRLVEAGSIYEKKLNNIEKAMNCYQMVVEKYSEHKKANEAAKKIEKLKQKMGQEDTDTEK